MVCVHASCADRTVIEIDEAPHRFNARMVGGDPVQQFFASSGNDDLVACLVKAQGQAERAGLDQEQVLATVRSSPTELHCAKDEAGQIDWQDPAG